MTPGSMVAEAPIHTSLPMRTGLATVLTFLRSSTGKSWLGVAMQTLGPMRVWSPIQISAESRKTQS